MARPSFRFVPRLAPLEDRDCPVTLNVGANVNISHVWEFKEDVALRDNQTEATIAIDPTDPGRKFAAAMNWHGGYVGAHSGSVATTDHRMGLFASYTTREEPDVWVGRMMASGGADSDSLPTAFGRPDAAFDQYGNLFVAYYTASSLQHGVTAVTEGSVTMSDFTRTWGTNQWIMPPGNNTFVSLYWPDGTLQMRQLVSNDAHTLTVSTPWGPVGTGTPEYMIHHYAGAHSVALVMSTDGGQSFTWVKNLAVSAGNTGPGTSYPDDQARVAVGPGPNGGGSVWVYHHSAGVGASKPTVEGASVSGLGQVGSFGAPQTTFNADGKRFGSIAVGPAGQLLLSYQSNMDFMGPMPYQARIYTAIDPDGLGPQPFTVNSATVGTQVYLQVDIPATRTPPVTPSSSPHAAPINASARLAWDRSGGAHHGRVYLVYTDRPNMMMAPNDTNVMLRYSDNNGASWSAATKLNDDATSTSQFWPSIAVDQTTGHVASIWMDARNDPANNTATRIYGTASTDGGVTFAANAAISAGTSTAAAAANHIHGTSTGGNGLRSLKDLGQNWKPDWWVHAATYHVRIVAGTGASYTSYRIVGNSANELFIDTDWAVVPDATSQYVIDPLYVYGYGGYTNVAYQSGAFYPAWPDNSNSTLNNPDGANRQLDTYIAAVTLTEGGGGGTGGGGTGGTGGGGGGEGNFPPPPGGFRMAPPAGGPGTEPTVAKSSTALRGSSEISSSPLRSEPVLTATPVRRSVPLAAGLSLDPNPDIEWDLGLPTWVTLPG